MSRKCIKTASSGIIALAILIAAVRPAGAQAAEAETLFREGRRLMKKGLIAEACPKLEASERLDPQFGTELNLGDCFAKHGQTASAWVMFVKAAATAKHANQEKRTAEARKRANILEKQLVYLTITVPDENKIDDLVIKRNGAPIDRGVWNQEVPLDPDDYTITAEAPGHTSWSQTVVVKTKSKVIELPKLEALELPPAPVDTGTAQPPPQPHAAATPRTSTARKLTPPVGDPHRKYRGATIALTVFGVAAAGVGTGLALYSSHVEGQADAVCPTTTCNDAHAVELNKVARTDGWVANIGWGLGGAALVGALALWWVGSPSHDNAISLVPIVDRSGVGFALGGGF